MSSAIPPCFNCGKKPTITRQSGRYPFRLDPPPGYGCPASFHLESHQKSRELCIADWNQYQKRESARLRGE